MSNLEAAVEFVTSLKDALSTALEVEQKKSDLAKEVDDLQEEKDRLTLENSQAKSALAAARTAEAAANQSREKKDSEAETFRAAEAKKIIEAARAQAATLVADAENRLRAAKQNEHESELKVGRLTKEAATVEAKLASLQAAHENFKRTIAVA